MSDIQQAIDSLNLAFKQDPVAMRALMINVVPCNKALADDHPTIQCSALEDGYTVSALGFLNGILGALGLPLIASKWESEANADGVHKLLGFQEYVPPLRKPTE